MKEKKLCIIYRSHMEVYYRHSVFVPSFINSKSEDFM